MINATIAFAPEAYTNRRDRPMGIHSASESFLRGYFAHASAGEFSALIADNAHAAPFESALRAAGRNEPVRFLGPGLRLGELRHSGQLYVPSPMIAEDAWRRTMFGDAAWSVCGITHTLCSLRAIGAITAIASAPVQPWDAVICTSAAARDAVERLLDDECERLRERLGATKFPLPQLPVIPLGIHTADFAYVASERARSRTRIGVDEASIVVLFFGRLSFHGKAHPLAMYRALEQASARTGKAVTLIECGAPPNDMARNAAIAAQALACPGVRVVTLDGRDAASSRAAWAAADVFCSLSDSIQETFGLTPLEAMAAGLPVVVSDWDGYRDTVRDGIDGFRVPTLTPPPGSGGDLGIPHALHTDSYDRYCGHVSMLSAVDVGAATAAFVRLFESADLRRSMGEAGRNRARAFDWASIIPRYEALWAQLAALRAAGAPGRDRAARVPARLDPFTLHATWPSAALAPDTVLALVDDSAEEAMQRFVAIWGLTMVNYAARVLPRPGEAAQVIRNAAGGPQTASALVQSIADDRRAIVMRGIVWLVKLGILAVVPEER